MGNAMTRYAERCGMEFDIGVNVLLGGALGQTVSLRAALAQRAGKPWGCILCRVLSVLVQRDHCADQFREDPTPGLVYVRAGLAFAAAIGAALGAANAVLLAAAWVF